MAERKYRIYVHRRDTDALIGDEDILVGNNAYIGKYTKGLSMQNPNYSYVEFNSWDELIGAVVNGEILNVSPTGTLEQVES